MSVACIGGAHIDTRGRILSDNVAPWANPAEVRRIPGGTACNVALNLGYLGIRVALFSILGEDVEGRILLDELARAGVNTLRMLSGGRRPTGTYVQIVDREDRRVVAVADMDIYELLDESWAARTVPLLAPYDTWVLDANLPVAALARIVAGAGSVRVVVDSISTIKARRVESVLGRVDVLLSGRAEAALLAGISEETSAATAAAAIRERGVKTVIISLGVHGAYYDDGVRREHIDPGPSSRAVDPTGISEGQLAGYLYALELGEASPFRWGVALGDLAMQTPESVRHDLTTGMLRAKMRG
jgi:pseudouridine kinase